MRMTRTWITSLPTLRIVRFCNWPKEFNSLLCNSTLEMKKSLPSPIIINVQLINCRAVIVVIQKPISPLAVLDDHRSSVCGRMKRSGVPLLNSQVQVLHWLSLDFRCDQISDQFIPMFTFLPSQAQETWSKCGWEGEGLQEQTSKVQSAPPSEWRSTWNIWHRWVISWLLCTSVLNMFHKYGILQKFIALVKKK